MIATASVPLLAPALAVDPDAVPVVALDGVSCAGTTRDPGTRLEATLTLEPSELVLVYTPRPVQGTLLANLCTGVRRPDAGEVRFLGHSWQALDDEEFNALRSLIGRVFYRGNWLDHMSIAENVLLPHLHHTRERGDRLLEEAARLARRFGLPGLSAGNPARADRAELQRAACVRAFLGTPRLVILEHPTAGLYPGVMPALVAVALFVVAASQAERFQQWLNPGITVKVLMPQEGLYGLSTGADVEILGTTAGKVRDIVVEPGQNIHAIVNLERQVAPFLRQDSQAFIKRRFGVAGDAYLEITRGTGAPLDLDYAVLEASAERIPTQTVEQLISEVRGRLVPILDKAEAAIDGVAKVSATLAAADEDVRAFVASLRGISRRIERGEGTIGRLVADDAVAVELEQVLRRTRDAMARLAPILDEMQGVARNAALMSERLGEQSAAIPRVTDRAVAALDSLESVLGDVKRTTPELPRLTRNVADSTQELPTLLLQSQQTLVELEGLIRQLRSSWLLGAGAQAPPPPARVPALEITP